MAVNTDNISEQIWWLNTDNIVLQPQRCHNEIFLKKISTKIYFRQMLVVNFDELVGTTTRFLPGGSPMRRLHIRLQSTLAETTRIDLTVLPVQVL